ncbi:MAG: hypothetical protein WCD31_07295 [Gillisia sp.]
MFDQEIAEQPEIENQNEEQPLPELYSKYVIIGFSVFFSTIFGAVLLMSNLKRVNEPKGRKAVLFFGIGYMLLSGVIVSLLMNNIAIILNVVGAAILNEYFWNKYIGKETDFEKRSWGRAFGISVLVVIPFVLLALNYGM